MTSPPSPIAFDWHKLPHMSKPADAERCQSIFLNLLELIMNQGIASDTLVREVFGTVRCGKALEDVRAIYEEDINLDNRTNLEKILRKEVDDGALTAAVDTVAHYRRWTRERVMAQLGWWNWIKFNLHEYRSEVVPVALGASAGLATYYYKRRRLVNEIRHQDGGKV